MSFIPQRISVGTISSVSGTTGTGAAGRVAYWQDATTLTSSASFTFDGTSLGVPDGAAATPAYTFASAPNTGFFLAGATRVDLSLGGSSIFEFSLYKMGVTSTGGNPARVTATAANTAGSAAFTEMTVLGGTGGDAYSKYSVFGAIDWFAGCHNSDSDKYKIANGGFGADNDFLTITAAGLVTLGAVNDNEEHVVNGRLSVVPQTNLPLKLTGNSSAGTITFANAAASGKYNWLIGGQFNTNNTFEVTPSTAVDGSTFSTPVFQCEASTGLITVGPAGATPIHRFNTATAATAGAAGDFLRLNVNGTNYKIQLYADS